MHVDMVVPFLCILMPGTAKVTVTACRNEYVNYETEGHLTLKGGF